MIDIPALGTTTHEISANDLMWDFFVPHPLPDSDGDGIPDVQDNCPSVATPWIVPQDDGDCDGFTTAVEDFIGTDPITGCGISAWPPDFDDNGAVNINDVFAVLESFGKSSAAGDWISGSHIRKDLDANDAININDMFIVLDFFVQSCT